MPDTPATDPAARLAERNCWLATTRPDGRAHLSAVWFTWTESKLWVCAAAGSRKVRNLRNNPACSFSLESGAEPVVAEGQAVLLARPFPDAVARAFIAKYEWDVNHPTESDAEYDTLIEITPARWLYGFVPPVS